MSNGVLTGDNKESEPFEFIGDCYICIKGEGAASIQRKMGNSFETLTNSQGIELTFVPNESGILFNDKISGNIRVKHRIIADTPTEITYEIVGGR